MKCKKCNQEMRFGQEACGTDINGVVVKLFCNTTT